MPQDYWERFYSIFTEQDKVGQSISLRKQIIEDAWQVFLQNPLGVGVGAFPLVRGEMFNRLQDTHNLYLEAATNLGIQGLILFLLLLWQIGRVLRQTRQGFDRPARTSGLPNGGKGSRIAAGSAVLPGPVLGAVSCFSWCIFSSASSGTISMKSNGGC